MSPPSDSTTVAVRQDQSPLWRLSLEIRHMIYAFCFVEEQIPGSHYAPGLEDKHLIDTSLESSVYDDWRASVPNWIRPGCTSRTKIATELLRTCQLVYQEALPVLLANSLHKCYHGYGPGETPAQYFEPFGNAALSQATQLQLYTQVHTFDKQRSWLRDQLKPVSQSLKHLTITFRHLGGAPDRPMLLNPFRLGSATRTAMASSKISFYDANKNCPMPKTGWAGAFTSLPKLQTLTIEMEDSEEREEQLQSLVDWAKDWQFPSFNEDRVLAVQSEPTTSSWRRPAIPKSHVSEEYQPPRIITWRLQWSLKPCESVAGIAAPKSTRRRKNEAAELDTPRNKKPKTRSTRFMHRPACDPRLGGLNSIFAHADDEAIQHLIDYGIL